VDHLQDGTFLGSYDCRNIIVPYPFFSWYFQPTWWTVRRGGYDERVGEDEGEKGEYVRIFVNDVRQPLHFCGAGVDGMCKLEKFLWSQEYAMNDGFGDKS